MKITSVDVMELKPRNSPRWRPVVCRINTDEGVYGYGEAAMAYGVGASGAFGMIKDLSRMILEKDPLDHEVIWDRLYKATFWGQNGGPVIFAGISAIDMALWDIKGKFFGLPLYRLLGGKRREKLRSYASQLQFGWGDGMTSICATEGYAAVAGKAVAEGYDAIKIDFFTFDKNGKNFSAEETTRLLKPYYLDLIEERIDAVRSAVGPKVDIIIEAHSVTDAQAAIQIGKRAEKYNIFAYEEPTTPTPKMTRLVADNVRIPLASGERIYTRWDYAPYFENGSLALIQPDLGTCGGITEGKKICDMAYTYDVSVQAHVCASPLSTAAALQLEAVIPNFCIHEHHVVNLTSYNKELCIYDYQPVDGYMSVPDIPGIGNELSEYALETADKLTVSRSKK
ncbi:MAG: mandelate racemase/muconate lactonizing enzyme family protein [Deltaproteobacteria bacterium]|nr:mandelate racemase/muconate lactonizing enzyme family protein [Deltaproteobacteria bacterium]